MTHLNDSARAGIGARLEALLREEARRTVASDVRIGLGYTAVALEDGRCGVALTLREALHGGCSAFEARRPLAGRRAADLLALLSAPNAVEAAVGLACANALANRESADHVPGDVLERIAIGPGDRVGMVGNFAPLVGAIDARARSLDIFERIERPEGRLRPESEAAAVLARCDVVFITASAIVNRTLDGLLDAAAGARDVVILGASTPLLGEAFSNRATALSGVVVTDASAILRTISEGGGMRAFRPHIRKVTLRLRDS